jgi:two-component system sensor histidine kinase DesK
VSRVLEHPVDPEADQGEESDQRGSVEQERAALIGELGRRAPAPTLASSIVVVVVLGYTVMGFTDIFTTGLDDTQIVAASVCFVGAAVLQLLHSYGRLAPLRDRLSPWTLLLQAVLTYLPLLGFGVLWGGMAGFLGASGLLLLRPAFGWAVFTAVAAAAAASGPLEGWTPLNCVYILVANVLTSLIVFGLTRLSQLVAEVQATRLHLARLAVTQERLRFSRDLHDLLGYSLSAITLKSELTRRLVVGNPELALEELGSIVEISRQACLDVRAVARGYRSMSLSDEAVAARSVLEAAGIHADIELGALPPEGALDTILATVLREAVTNLLRHSKAEQCVISTRAVEDRIVLSVANDGLVATAPAAGTERAGSGLANLTARLAEIGGRLTWGLDGDGWFLIAAEAELASTKAVTGQDRSV